MCPPQDREERCQERPLECPPHDREARCQERPPACPPQLALRRCHERREECHERRVRCPPQVLPVRCHERPARCPPQVLPMRCQERPLWCQERPERCPPQLRPPRCHERRVACPPQLLPPRCHERPSAWRPCACAELAAGRRPMTTSARPDNSNPLILDMVIHFPPIALADSVQPMSPQKAVVWFAARLSRRVGHGKLHSSTFPDPARLRAGYHERPRTCQLRPRVCHDRPRKCPDCARGGARRRPPPQLRPRACHERPALCHERPTTWTRRRWAMSGCADFTMARWCAGCVRTASARPA